MTESNTGPIERCEVCNETVDTEADFDQFDPRAPVYADSYIYHLGCEDGVFEWSSGTELEE